MLAASVCSAQSARVSSWNLRPAGTNELRVTEAAEELKKVEPDVILLQNVPDWKTCDQLVQALKPAKYNVLICSAFRDASHALTHNQVAILSKYRGYSSWSEASKTGDQRTSGFAFAALRIANQPLGFYSVEASAAAALDPLARQLGAHAKSVLGWQANQVDALLAGVTFTGADGDSTPTHKTFVATLGEAGFGEGSAQTTDVAARDFLFSEPPGFSGPPNVLSNSAFQQACLTYDLQLDPVKLAAAKAAFVRPVAKAPVVHAESDQPAQAHPATVSAPAPVTTPTVALVPISRAPDTKLIAITAVASVALLGAIWFMLRLAIRRPVPQEQKLLEDGGASSYTIIVGTKSATGGLSADLASSLPSKPKVHIESPKATHTQTEILRQRALAAERKAEEAQEALRSGVVANFSFWMKQKFVRKLIADRSQMLETQQAATMKVLRVEERLTKIEAQINLQNLGYQQRIDDLTRDLIAAKEENRELIRAQIRQVKAEMEAARARMLADAEDRDEDKL